MLKHQVDQQTFSEIQISGSQRNDCFANNFWIALLDQINEGFVPENADARCALFLNTLGFTKWTKFADFFKEEIKKTSQKVEFENLYNTFGRHIRGLIVELRSSTDKPYNTIQHDEKESITALLMTDCLSEIFNDAPKEGVSDPSFDNRALIGIIKTTLANHKNYKTKEQQENFLKYRNGKANDLNEDEKKSVEEIEDAIKMAISNWLSQGYKKFIDHYAAKGNLGDLEARYLSAFFGINFQLYNRNATESTLTVAASVTTPAATRTIMLVNVVEYALDRNTRQQYSYSQHWHYLQPQQQHQWKLDEISPVMMPQNKPVLVCPQQTAVTAAINSEQTVLPQNSATRTPTLRSQQPVSSKQILPKPQRITSREKVAEAGVNPEQNKPAIHKLLPKISSAPISSSRPENIESRVLQLKQPSNFTDTYVLALFDKINCGFTPDNADERYQLFLDSVNVASWLALTEKVKNLFSKKDTTPNQVKTLQAVYGQHIRQLIAKLRDSENRIFHEIRLEEQQALKDSFKKAYRDSLLEIKSDKPSPQDLDNLIDKISEKLNTSKKALSDLVARLTKKTSLPDEMELDKLANYWLGKTWQQYKANYVKQGSPLNYIEAQYLAKYFGINIAFDQQKNEVKTPVNYINAEIVPPLNLKKLSQVKQAENAQALYKLLVELKIIKGVVPENLAKLPFEVLEKDEVCQLHPDKIDEKCTELAKHKDNYNGIDAVIQRLAKIKENAKTKPIINFTVSLEKQVTKNAVTLLDSLKRLNIVTEDLTDLENIEFNQLQLDDIDQKCDQLAEKANIDGIDKVITSLKDISKPSGENLALNLKTILSNSVQEIKKSQYKVLVELGVVNEAVPVENLVNLSNLTALENVEFKKLHPHEIFQKINELTKLKGFGWVIDLLNKDIKKISTLNLMKISEAKEQQEKIRNLYKLLVDLEIVQGVVPENLAELPINKLEDIEFCQLQPDEIDEKCAELAKHKDNYAEIDAIIQRLTKIKENSVKRDTVNFVTVGGQWNYVPSQNKPAAVSPVVQTVEQPLEFQAKVSAQTQADANTSISSNQVAEDISQPKKTFSSVNKSTKTQNSQSKTTEQQGNEKNKKQNSYVNIGQQLATPQAKQRKKNKKLIKEQNPELIAYSNNNSIKEHLKSMQPKEQKFCFEAAFIVALFDQIDNGFVQPIDANNRCQLFLNELKEDNIIKVATWQAFVNHVRGKILESKNNPSFIDNLQTNYAKYIRQLLFTLRMPNDKHSEEIKEIQREELFHIILDSINGYLKLGDENSPDKQYNNLILKRILDDFFKTETDKNIFKQYVTNESKLDATNLAFAKKVEIDLQNKISEALQSGVLQYDRFSLKYLSAFFGINIRVEQREANHAPIINTYEYSNASPTITLINHLNYDINPITERKLVQSQYWNYAVAEEPQSQLVPLALDKKDKKNISPPVLTSKPKLSTVKNPKLKPFLSITELITKNTQRSKPAVDSKSNPPALTISQQPVAQKMSDIATANLLTKFISKQPQQPGQEITAADALKILLDFIANTEINDDPNNEQSKTKKTDFVNNFIGKWLKFHMPENYFEGSEEVPNYVEALSKWTKTALIQACDIAIAKMQNVAEFFVAFSSLSLAPPLLIKAAIPKISKKFESTLQLCEQHKLPFSPENFNILKFMMDDSIFLQVVTKYDHDGGKLSVFPEIFVQRLKKLVETKQRLCIDHKLHFISSENFKTLNLAEIMFPGGYKLNFANWKDIDENFFMYSNAQKLILLKSKKMLPPLLIKTYDSSAKNLFSFYIYGQSIKGDKQLTLLTDSQELYQLDFTKYDFIYISAKENEQIHQQIQLQEGHVPDTLKLNDDELFEWILTYNDGQGQLPEGVSELLFELAFKNNLHRIQNSILQKEASFRGQSLPSQQKFKVTSQPIIPEPPSNLRDSDEFDINGDRDDPNINDEENSDFEDEKSNDSVESTNPEFDYDKELDKTLSAKPNFLLCSYLMANPRLQQAMWRLINEYPSLDKKLGTLLHAIKTNTISKNKEIIKDFKKDPRIIKFLLRDQSFVQPLTLQQRTNFVKFLIENKILDNFKAQDRSETAKQKLATDKLWLLRFQPHTIVLDLFEEDLKDSNFIIKILQDPLFLRTCSYPLAIKIQSFLGTKIKGLTNITDKKSLYEFLRAMPTYNLENPTYVQEMLTDSIVLDQLKKDQKRCVENYRKSKKTIIDPNLEALRKKGIGPIDFIYYWHADNYPIIQRLANLKLDKSMLPVDDFAAVSLSKKDKLVQLRKKDSEKREDVFRDLLDLDVPTAQGDSVENSNLTDNLAAMIANNTLPVLHAKDINTILAYLTDNDNKLKVAFFNYLAKKQNKSFIAAMQESLNTANNPDHNKIIAALKIPAINKLVLENISTSKTTTAKQLVLLAELEDADSPNPIKNTSKSLVNSGFFSKLAGNAFNYRDASNIFAAADSKTIARLMLTDLEIVNTILTPRTFGHNYQLNQDGVYDLACANNSVINASLSKKPDLTSQLNNEIDTHIQKFCSQWVKIPLLFSDIEVAQTLFAKLSLIQANPIYNQRSFFTTEEIDLMFSLTNNKSIEVDEEIPDICVDGEWFGFNEYLSIDLINIVDKKLKEINNFYLNQYEDRDREQIDDFLKLYHNTDLCGNSTDILRTLLVDDVRFSSIVATEAKFSNEILSQLLLKHEKEVVNQLLGSKTIGNIVAFEGMKTILRNYSVDDSKKDTVKKIFAKSSLPAQETLISIFADNNQDVFAAFALKAERLQELSGAILAKLYLSCDAKSEHLNEFNKFCLIKIVSDAEPEQFHTLIQKDKFKEQLAQTFQKGFLEEQEYFVNKLNKRQKNVFDILKLNEKILHEFSATTLIELYLCHPDDLNEFYQASLFKMLTEATAAELKSLIGTDFREQLLQYKKDLLELPLLKPMTIKEQPERDWYIGLLAEAISKSSNDKIDNFCDENSEREEIIDEINKFLLPKQRGEQVNVKHLTNSSESTLDSIDCRLTAIKDNIKAIKTDDEAIFEQIKAKTVDLNGELKLIAQNYEEALKGNLEINDPKVKFQIRWIDINLPGCAKNLENLMSLVQSETRSNLVCG